MWFIGLVFCFIAWGIALAIGSCDFSGYDPFEPSTKELKEPPLIFTHPRNWGWVEWVAVAMIAGVPAINGLWMLVCFIISKI